MGCSPKMAGCSMQCGHKQLVMGYREEYQRQYDALVEESGGYSTEIADNMRQRREAGNPLPQFKDWLKGLKRPDDMADLTMNQLDHRALAEGVPLESPRFLEDWSNQRGMSFLTDVHPSLQNEALLLATALRSDAGVEALRVIEAREFRSGFHVNVRQAILDQADAGLPHNAAAVNQVLRERPLSPDALLEPRNEGPYGPDNPWTPALKVNSQLPDWMDPTGKPVDPRLYGLGAWETYSPPSGRAPLFAQTVRAEYRGREAVAICERGAAMARGAISYDSTGLLEQDLIGEMRVQLATELRALPFPLDENLQRAVGHNSNAAALPGQKQLGGPGLEPVTLVVQPMKVVTGDLQLPPLPVLSAAGREALSRG